MAKIAPASAKYIVHASITIDGIVDRPDVIGAIFGQTEGLLGADLELRELQRSGRIGRIEVSTNVSSGKTNGEIIIPSSLDKAETCIVGAALETIERIGPCSAKVGVSSIEDVRITKRNFVVEKAKKLLRILTESTLPDSQEITEEVAYSVRMMEIKEYGPDRLPAGPAVKESDEVIIVEGRADVLMLLKHGIKNVIAMNGTSCPNTIKELTKQKITTVFVDGDRGGDLIIRELLNTSEIDFVTKAPDGKEVEELTKKEIHKALRSKMAAEQAKLEFGTGSNVGSRQQSRRVSGPRNSDRRNNHFDNKTGKRASAVKEAPAEKKELSEKERSKVKELLDDIVGTRGAVILDKKMSLLGKVPYSELKATISGLGPEAYITVMDGALSKDILSAAEKSGIKFIATTDTKSKNISNNLSVITDSTL